LLFAVLASASLGQIPRRVGSWDKG
jgi:hypothetical protein